MFGLPSEPNVKLKKKKKKVLNEVEEKA